MYEPVDDRELSGERTTPLLALAPLRARARYEQVAERLLADLRAGRLADGQRLPGERDLARRLGVGRASVREALAALQVEGLLETRPGAGSFVAAGAAARAGAGDRAQDGGAPVLGLARDASPSDVLEARLLLEPGVARLAAVAASAGGAGAARRDPEAERLLGAMDAAARHADLAAWHEGDRRFHRRLAALTGNPVLLAFADHVAALMDQPLWARLRDDSVAEPGRAAVHAAEHRLIHEAIAEGDGDAAAFHAEHHLRRVRRYMTLDQE